MTEAPPRSVDDSQPVERLRVRRERPRFPLALKLFLLVALLIASVVATAVGVTLQRAGGIARETVNKSITNASHLFRELEENRYARLTLGVRPLASDPYFVAYIEDARTQVVELPEGETGGTEPGPPILKPEGIASVLDQLQSRREGIGSDLMMVTDAEGYLLGRTDQTNVTSRPAEDLYESEPLLKALIDRGGTDPAIGVIATGGRLYHAVAMPLAVGPAWVPKGYVVNALAIDEQFANRIAESTNASVVFVGAGDSPFASRSTDAPSIPALRGLADLAPMLESGKALTPRSVSIHGSAYVLTGGALQSGGRPLGAAIFVRSLDRELAPYREIERTLWLAGGLSLLVALALSFLLASRVTKPISDLAGMAQAVTAGDYSVQPDIRRQDEVGILSASFATMVSALRDKEELERLYEQMAIRIKEKESTTQSFRRPPAAEEATVLVTELRGLAVSADPADAERLIALIAQCVRLQEAEVRRQEGHVREIAGQRLISTFDGERGAARAVRAARAIFEELATMRTDGAPLTVACGVATGEFVTGTVTTEGVSGMAIAGNAPQLALLFASEAPTGHAFLALESAQSAGADIAGAATREEVRLRWLPAPVSVHSLPLQGFATGTHHALTAAGSDATLVLEAGGAPRIPIREELAPGALFASRYLIEQTLGRGGMGVVYRALDRQLEETVAIKTLPGDVMMRSPAELERFKREIRLARRITHRNVLRTYDYGEADGVYFISMEFVRGYTLAELMQQTQPVALRAALGIGRQICRGLHAAHEQGIIHRDIKPQNVLIDPKGEVKLMDFGIARMSESAEAMTAAGLIVGTPHYMSPEQVQGKPVDTRSDVYSMGVVLYEMLCGVRPFDDSSLTAVLAAHLTRPVRPPIELRADVGDAVNSIVLRCLNKDPRHRYADAGELLRDLDRVQTAV